MKRYARAAEHRPETILTDRQATEAQRWFNGAFDDALISARSIRGVLTMQQFADKGERFLALIEELRCADTLTWAALLESEPVKTRAKLAIAIEIAHVTTMFDPGFGYDEGLSSDEVCAAHRYVLEHFAREHRAQTTQHTSPDESPWDESTIPF